MKTAITGDYVPKLSTNVSFKPFDNKSYLVCVDSENETKLTISGYTKTLLELVDGAKSVNELTHCFNQKHGSNYTIDQITGIFNGQLLGYGIFEEDSDHKVSPKDDYLRLRLTLISSKLVASISKLFIFLFSKRVFITVSITCIIILSYFFIMELDFKEFYKNMTPNFFVYFLTINLLGIFFHEFGHASACQRFGARSGAIGFGFYLFTPVFYADVTDAWRLQRSERLIVDMGGVYMQLIYCVFLVALSHILYDKIYLHIAFSIVAIMIVNVNPFLRFDGYWALSDLTGIPNLRSKSNESLQLLGRSIFKKERSFKLTTQNIFLVIYGTISFIFVISFVLYIVLVKHNSIIYFPYNVFVFFKTLITTIPNVEFAWVKDSLAAFILPAMFYTLLIRYLWRRRAKLLGLFRRKSQQKSVP